MDAATPQSDTPKKPFTDRIRGWLSHVPRKLWIILGSLTAVGVAGLVFLWFLVGRGLPDAASLANYQPPLPSNLRAADGTPFHTFARERRIYLPYSEIPPVIVQAVTSAEDKTFFEHEGLDYAGIANAVLVNIQNLGGDKRPIGASTITQQVAKNLLLTNEVTLGRKLREAVLARRIEQQFTKADPRALPERGLPRPERLRNRGRIAGLFRQARRRNSQAEEAALLAGLLKAPSAYNPRTNYARALERRNYVLGEMARNGHLTPERSRQLQAQPIVTTPAASHPARPSAAISSRKFAAS
jgi:penicillin-binding protein 1A